MAKHAVCGRKCEVFSRCCGYFRPVALWNKGLREQFKNRKPYVPTPIIEIEKKTGTEG
jgi:ribonucleoside-triphosphate reductase